MNYQAAAFARTVLAVVRGSDGGFKLAQPFQEQLILLVLRIEFPPPFLNLLLQSLDSRLLCIALRLLSLNLVEQHDCQHLVFHRLNLAVSRTGNEIGVNLGHFLGDEAILDRLGASARDYL